MKKPSNAAIARAAEDRRANWHRMVDDLAGWLFYGSIAVTVASLAYLIYALVSFSGTGANYNAQDLQRLKDVILLVGQVYLGALIVMVVSVGWLFYEQEALGYVLLAGGAFVYYALPMGLKTAIGEGKGTKAIELSALALQQIQLGVWVFGVPAVLFILADLGLRLRNRILLGAKNDNLQFGVGIIEEASVRQRFLGKCWQLPYCRKFVRERCPIFHSRRSCWRERVGCMCEENVINNAMKGVQTFSKDTLANAKYIPYNNKLPLWVKKERCRNCVIYNEHQRQKYQLVSPLAAGSYLALAFLFHDGFLSLTRSLLAGIDNFIQRLSLNPTSAVKADSTANVLQSTSIVAEMMYLCLAMVLLSYLMKFIEFLIFKLKV